MHPKHFEQNQIFEQVNNNIALLSGNKTVNRAATPTKAILRQLCEKKNKQQKQKNKCTFQTLQRIDPNFLFQIIALNLTIFFNVMGLRKFVKTSVGGLGQVFDCKCPKLLLGQSLYLYVQLVTLRRLQIYGSKAPVSALLSTLL